MDRQPVVAGQFYPGQTSALNSQVRQFLGLAKTPAAGPTLLAMAPHAGYAYSGPVAGATFGQADLARTVLLLGPNHTGLGLPFALWPGGDWRIPGVTVPVDKALTQALLQADERIQADEQAHLHEHSLEVLLPFLLAVQPEARVAAMAISAHNLAALTAVAGSIAAVLRDWPEPVSLVVSSDMSHYVSQEQARRLDFLALAQVETLDPQGLFETVRRNGVTMCGVQLGRYRG